MYLGNFRIRDYDMKPGNLVCYNAAGMKKKTLGLVVENASLPAHTYGPTRPHVLIQWCVVGEYMPRRSYHRMETPHVEYGTPISSGELVWHESGEWFEVVS